MNKTPTSLAKQQKAIARRLRFWFRRKKDAGVYRSQSSFAEAMGAAPRTGPNWFKEGGGSIPDGPHLLAMGRRAGISIDWLLLGRGSADLASTKSGTREGWLKRSLAKRLSHLSPLWSEQEFANSLPSDGEVLDEIARLILPAMNSRLIAAAVERGDLPGKGLTAAQRKALMDLDLERWKDAVLGRNT